LELAVSRIEHDGEPAMLATFRDITDRKRRERSVKALQQAMSEMQTADSPERVAEIATAAAGDALGLPLSACWFYDSDKGELAPAVATDPVYDRGYFEPLSPDQYEFDVFRDGSVTRYSPSETGYDRLETGVLLPLGEHGLLAAGRPEPTDHDTVVLGVARTLAEHARIALDRIERTRELERTQARFRALTENTSYGVVTIDDTSTVRYASGGISDVLGYEPVELEGKSLLEIMPDRYHEAHEDAVARYLREEEKRLDWSWIELPGVHSDGHEVPLGISFGEATVDGERRFSAVIRDISEQRRRQRELREERAFTESIFATLPDVFYAFDEHGEFLRWNDRLTEVTGYADEEIVSMHPAEFITPDDRDEVVTAIAEVFERDTKVTVEARFETKDGARIPYEFTGAQLTDDTGEVLGLVGIGRDISDRKERERRFKAVFDNTYQFTGLMEPDGTLIEVNETALEFGDLDREDVVGDSVWNAFWFTHSEELRSEVRSAVERAAGGEFVRDEIPVQGSEREAIIDFSIRPVRDEDGAVTLLIPEGRDITELKRREEELRRERDHVRRTEGLANVGGWEFVPETGALHWTQGTYRLHEVGDSFEPSVERALEFVHGDDTDAVERALGVCRETGNPFDIEVRIVTAQGRTRWVRIEGDLVVDDGTEKLRGVVGDITDRKEREQRLMVLNRILRHNLRNKLSVVAGYADTLETMLTTAPSERDISVDRAVQFTRKIEASADDLTTLGEKAREFERTVERTDTTGFVEVERVVSDVVSTYHGSHPGATITTELTGLTVRGSAEFLKLAVGELIDNAIRHSERSDPTVTIETSHLSGEQAEIRVADNGPGIPDMERKTLTEGEESSLLHGSGLGLWTVNWLVTRIGGHIAISDSDPRGSVVMLRLPAVKDG
jgi:PAS domain S-box-containing protein